MTLRLKYFAWVAKKVTPQDSKQISLLTAASLKKSRHIVPLYYPDLKRENIDNIGDKS